MPAALIQPNLEHAINWLKENNIICDSLKNAIKEPLLVEAIEKEINLHNQNFGSWEQIKKIELTPGLDVDALLATIAGQYQHEELSTIDGVKITWSDRWVHMRKSNTEPIIRIYTEAPSTAEALELGERFIQELEALAK